MAASPQLSVGLPCPACGGAVQVEEAAKSTACPYCASLLWVEGDAGVRRIMFKNLLGRDQVLAAARKWFDKGREARHLDPARRETADNARYVHRCRDPCLAAGW